MPRKTWQLTKHKTGSMRELFVIIAPLVISYFSNTLMLFADRAILAHYSLEVMNAAAIAGNLCWLFHFAIIMIVTMSEVVVGKLNGERQYKKLGEPVWQVFWFWLLCFAVFYMMSIYTPQLFLPANYYETAKPYYQIILSWGSIAVLNFGIIGFFIAIGSTKVITIATLAGNIVNILLDFLLVFGYKDIVPSMGISGAAYATVIGVAVEIVIVLCFFFSKRYREKYNTHKPTWNFGFTKDFFRAGFFPSVGYFAEMLAWITLLYVLAMIGEIHTAVMAIGQTIFILLIAVTDSIKKGVVSICSNLIGAKKEKYHRYVLASAFKLHNLIMLGFIAVTLLFSGYILDFFVAENTSKAVTDALINDSLVILFFVVLFYYLDGFCWIYSGFLIAKGYTKSVMAIVIFSAWFCGAMPITIFFYKTHASYTLIWILYCCYAFVELLLYKYKAKSVLKADIV